MQHFHQFQYDATGAGELARITFPYGGYLRYAYRNFTFSDNRTLREVEYRYLAPSPGGAELMYTISRDPADTGRTLHWYGLLHDAGGQGIKIWYFRPDTGLWDIGLPAQINEYDVPSGITKRWQALTWAQDAAGNPYLASVLTTLDNATAYQKQSKTEQTLDTHGNVTQTKIYDYGSLTTPARTYTHTYVTDSNYTSRHIWNRLLSTYVSDGVNNVQLVYNIYDMAYLTNVENLRNHDTANYGLSFTWRGNVTRRLTPGAINNFRYDITGNLRTADDDNGHTVSVTPSAVNNYAAPGAVTTAGLTTTMSWSGFLGLTNETGPNTESLSFSYDNYARPASSTSPHGAVTSYVYTDSPPTKKATTNGHWVKTTLDGLGRTVKVETGDASGTKSPCRSAIPGTPGRPRTSTKATR